MTTAVRALIGLGTIGGVATGGVLLNKYLSNEDIQSKLEANCLKLLADDFNSRATWQKILTNYRLVAKTENKLKFKDFDGGSKDVNTDTESINTLKQKCKELAKKKVSEDKDNILYEQAKRWCIVPVSISKLLEKEYKTLSVKVENKETDKSIWEEKIKGHKDQKNEGKRIKDLTFAVGEKKEEEHLKQIKEKCKEISDSENHSEKFEEYQQNYKDWCSTKITS